MELKILDRIDFNSPSLGIYFLILAALVGYISYSYKSYPRNILLANFNTRLLNNQSQDESNLSRKASIWLTFYFILVVGLILFFLLKKFHFNQFNLSDSALLIFAASLSLVGYLLKTGFKIFIGFLFKLSPLNLSANFILGLKDKAFAIIIFPFLILYGFSLPLEELAEYGIIGISGLYLIYRWIHGIIIGFKKGNLPIVYSILYICTLEILPLILVLKVISKLQS